MAIRIDTPYGVIEADTIQEFNEVIKQLQMLGGIPKIPDSQNMRKSRGIKFEKKRNHASFFKYLGASKQAEVLRIINEFGADGATDTDIRDRLQLGSNSALAGVMAGLSKRAKKSGLSMSDIIQVEQSIRDGKSHYNYKLTEKMAEAIPIETQETQIETS